MQSLVQRNLNIQRAIHSKYLVCFAILISRALKWNSCLSPKQFPLTVVECQKSYNCCLKIWPKPFRDRPPSYIMENSPRELPYQVKSFAFVFMWIAPLVKNHKSSTLPSTVRSAPWRTHPWGRMALFRGGGGDYNQQEVALGTGPSPWARALCWRPWPILPSDGPLDSSTAIWVAVPSVFMDEDTWLRGRWHTGHHTTRQRYDPLFSFSVMPNAL